MAQFIDFLSQATGGENLSFFKDLRKLLYPSSNQRNSSAEFLASNESPLFESLLSSSGMFRYNEYYDVAVSAKKILTGVIQNIKEPQDEWEKIAGYLATQGKPVLLYVHEDKTIEAISQEELASDPENNLRPHFKAHLIPRGSERRKLQSALSQVSDIKNKIDTHATQFQTLEAAQHFVERALKMELASAPKNSQELKWHYLVQLGHPVTITVDDDHHVKVLDQITDPSIPESYSPKNAALLKSSLAQIPDLLHTQKPNINDLPQWQKDILLAVHGKKAYFLTIENNHVVTKIALDKNNNTNQPWLITPDLIPSPLSYTNDFEKKVAQLIHDRSPFFINTNQHPASVEELTPSAIALFTSRHVAPASDLTLNSILDIFI